MCIPMHNQLIPITVCMALISRCSQIYQVFMFVDNEVVLEAKFTLILIIKCSMNFISSLSMLFLAVKTYLGLIAQRGGTFSICPREIGFKVWNIQRP